MTTRRHNFGATFRAAMLGALAMLLGGCNDAELRTRISMVESRLDSASEKPAELLPPASSLPLNAAPIRSLVVPTELPEKETLLELLRAQLLAPVPFSVKHEKNGTTTISGMGSFGDLGETWLVTHGFSKLKNGNVERHVDTFALPQIERLVTDALHAATSQLNQTARAFRSDHPGAVGFEGATPRSGHVVSTGNRLDFAFADAGGTPEFFIDMGTGQTDNEKVDGVQSRPHTLVRGGQLIVKDGYVCLQFNPLHRLIETKVPDNTTHLSLNTEGLVTAYDATGKASELGRIACVRVKRFKASCVIDETASVDDYIKVHGKGPFMPGYLVFSEISNSAFVVSAAEFRNTLLALQTGLLSAPKPVDPAADAELLPLIIYAPLPKTTEHLQALKIPVEKTTDRTTIGTASDETDVANALVAVLQGLRKRMTINEENLRSADKTRDSEGRLNPYRRKTLAIGPKGNLVEGVDKSDFRKVPKPGDPDAGPDGNVIMSNVNKAVETAEFKASIDEYKLVRAALERLAPKHIFPDPPNAP